MEYNDPLVSVVIPCYNQAVYLTDAVNSILGQTYSNWEIIIVNDGSPDDTESLALAFVDRDHRIRYVNKKNGGLSSARNEGIRQAKGEFILPLDADDSIEPVYIEEAMHVFQSNPSVKLVYCYANLFGTESGFWECARYTGYSNLLLGNAIFCSAMFRKKDWALIGGYDEHMLNGHEDWEFFIRLLYKDERVVQIPRLLFNYRRKDVSMVTLSSQKSVLNETEFYIYQKHKELYAEFFGVGVISALREYCEYQAKREEHKNKWYRKFYHRYVKRDRKC